MENLANNELENFGIYNDFINNFYHLDEEIFILNQISILEHTNDAKLNFFGAYYDEEEGKLFSLLGSNEKNIDTIYGKFFIFSSKTKKEDNIDITCFYGLVFIKHNDGTYNSFHAKCYSNDEEGLLFT
jgi:hypothetical protein